MIFDASALLVVVFGEPGNEIAAPQLGGAMISAVNLAEVMSKLIDRGLNQFDAQKIVKAFQLTVVPFDQALAIESGMLRLTTRHKGLSLGDRACLALARREGVTVVTADRQWAGLDIGCNIEVIR